MDWRGFFHTSSSHLPFLPFWTSLFSTLGLEIAARSWFRWRIVKCETGYAHIRGRFNHAYAGQGEQDEEMDKVFGGFAFYDGRN